MSNILKWIRLIIIILPTFIFLCGINYYEDPANIFHNNSKNVAESILNGKEAYFGSGNGDERDVKYNTIEGLPKHLDCITLGPSLAMGIRTYDVGTNSYHNLSASGLNFNDFMGQIAMLEAYGVKYDRVVFCVDSYFFDETFAVGARNEFIMPYAEYMISKLDGENPAMPEVSPDNGDIKTQIEQFFSITYFQSSVDLIRNNNSIFLPAARWGVIDESTQDLAHYAVDGSWVYAADYRDNTVDDVVNAANEYPIETQFAYDRHLSDYYKVHFKKLIKYLLDNGVEVEFFLCPLCPTLWDRLEADSEHYFMLDEIEEYAHEVADEYDIKLTGSYDPYIVGVSDADFWDARHMQHDKLSEFFDFME
ncbi:MAG: hypothetical protein VZR06_02315 [Butyrivibrio sp.]|nr:hypothetical protein [Butyrivibrio sp.]